MTPIPVIILCLLYIIFWLLTSANQWISMLTEMFSWRPLRMASILHLCFRRMLPAYFTFYEATAARRLG